MIDITYHGVAIQIKLDNGVYVFPSSSADGKTYLGRILRQFGNDERVTYYTFEDMKFLIFQLFWIGLSMIWCLWTGMICILVLALS